jgi:hypothetical protein
MKHVGEAISSRDSIQLKKKEHDMRTRRYLPILFAALTLPAIAAAPPAVLKIKPKVDVRKGRIERPVKKAIAGPYRNATKRTEASKVKTKVDVRKSVIESPVKRVIATKVRTTTKHAETRNSTTANPRVKPGDVKWHANLTAARKAASRSRKPILLFQMIGQLDQRFT